jgi:hypothetical protein
MKPFLRFPGPRWLALNSLLLALSLGVATDVLAGSETKTKAVPKAKAAAKKQKPAKAQVKYVEVTGSHLNVRIIDPAAAENQGYSSPLEMLMRNPSIGRGYRGP